MHPGAGRTEVVPGANNVLVAYAAKAGPTADDEPLAKHTRYTSALLKHLAAPEIDIRIALGRVRDEVLRETNGRQEPFVYGSLGGTEVPINSQRGNQKRVALVIGISAYNFVPHLATPADDGSAVAKMLKDIGFDVISQSNVDNVGFRRAVRDFTMKARDADMAIVFYAGHGIEVRGTNYLIPTDAKLASDMDVSDEAISLDRIVDSVQSAKRLGLVILDAARDNPFIRKIVAPK
jgi:uncharacterized caspase-like protein